MSQASAEPVTTGDGRAGSIATSQVLSTPEDRALRNNMEVTAEAVRAFQAENAQFAGRLLELNLNAARALAGPQAANGPLAAPFELGATAVELYFGYLGRCTALSQQAIVAPWTAGRRLGRRGAAR